MDGDGKISFTELGSVFVGYSLLNVVLEVSKFMAASTSNEERMTNATSKSIERVQDGIDSLDKRFTTPEMSKYKVGLIVGSALLSIVSPAFLGLHTVELLIPAMTAISATIGAVSEYQAKAAIANGREIVAMGQLATAESEIYLSQAERVKTVVPLCVGVAATAAGFTVLLPEFMESAHVDLESELLFCPLIAVLSAALAGLAMIETESLVARSMDVGKRRFASAKKVVLSWKSDVDLVNEEAAKLTGKWVSFTLGIVPAPIIAGLFPVDIENKAIICAAVATAQAAFSLVIVERALTAGCDAFAVKARARLFATTYQHEATRTGALLPYTSALGAVCVAGSAAAAEFLPIIPFKPLRYVAAAVFPLVSTAIAMAASIGKTRCEVGACAMGCTHAPSCAHALCCALLRANDILIILVPFHSSFA